MELAKNVKTNGEWVDIEATTNDNDAIDADIHARW